MSLDLRLVWWSRSGDGALGSPGGKSHVDIVRGVVGRGIIN
jgi:hypothetical protein